MTNDELNSRCATDVMRWQVQGDSYVPALPYDDAPESPVGPTSWSPSTDINHALQLLQRFADYELLCLGPTCRVAVYNDQGQLTQGEASNLALAICLTALSAVGPNVTIEELPET